MSNQLFGNSTVVAIDFGTSKIAATVGRLVNGSHEITGEAVVPYAGFRGAQWLEPDLLTTQVGTAFEEAVKNAGVKKKDVFVGIPGEFTRVYFRKAQVVPSGPDMTVTEEDLFHLTRMASDFTGVKDHVVVRNRTVAWQLDDLLTAQRPVGQSGESLTVFVSIVTAENVFIQMVESIAQQLGLTVVGFIPSIVALGAWIDLTEVYEDGTPEDRTTLIVDGGHFSTDVMILQFGQIVYHRSIAAGGYHLTSDIAQVMKLSAEEAEAAKRHCGVGVPMSGNGMVELVVNETSLTIDARLAQEIMEARLDDIVARVVRETQRFGLTLDRDVRVILAGAGLGAVRGVKEFFSGRLGITVRNISQTDASVPPELVTVNALLRTAAISQKNQRSGFFGR
ncbi:MAG: cell division FtsA domain-containing protein [Christensenellales bacterium]